MRRTTAPAATPDVSLFVGASAQVLDKSPAETLAMVVEQRRVQDEAAARELVAVTHWADLHRVPDHVDAVDPDACGDAAVVHRSTGQPTLGREGELWLAGEGVFAVEEFAVCQLATALGMSESAARRYVGEGLELRERLPKLWDRVHAGDAAGRRLPVWKARQIAAETIPLNAAAAAYVDAHLAPFAATMSIRRILRAVHAAVIRHDHELAAERAAKAAEGRGVWVDDDLDGTSRITAVTTTPDAAAFEAAIHSVAGDLQALGSTAPEQVRRATAVGILADPQHALDLRVVAAEAAAADEAGAAGVAAPAAGAAARPRTTTQHAPTIHIHLHTDAVTGMTSETGTGHVARVQGYGPRTLETVQQWLTGLAPGATIKLTPVVDLTEHISVDAYEVPDRLRAQIEHRDHGCRFPWCGRQGRFDADHIDEYVPLDKGGPPEQTSTANLARLCRFHHRVKTHTRWRYRREPDGAYLWTSPHGHAFTVDEHGTTAH